MNLEERLDEIEFRMDLLREGSDFSLFLYDYKITKSQLGALYGIMQKYREDIDGGKEVSSVKYEAEVLDVVRRCDIDYHFCETFAQLLWKDRRYEEVFKALYKDNIKYKHLFNE